MLSAALTVLLAALAIVATHAHICMWQPAQRAGAFQITNPGEHVCYLKVGPCGDVASATPLTTLQGGKAFNVLFQQNLNHYYIQNPGKLVADFATVADPTEADFVELGYVSDYNAMNEITQTNFTLPVMIPNVAVDHGVLRLRYFSNNPTENDRGMIFYQCADVAVTQTAEEVPKPVAAVAPKLVEESASHECCAAKQFTMQAYETSSWRQNTQKQYYFDAVSQLFRVDTISGSGVTPRDGSFQMYNNFTSGIEYYYNVATGTCDLYGLNYWSDWCYGAVNAQVHHADLTIGNEFADVWTQSGPNDKFFWTNARHSCVPVSQYRSDTGESTFYFNFKEGAPDASVFALPAACVSAEMQFRGRNGDVKTLPKAPVAHHDKPARR